MSSFFLPVVDTVGTIVAAVARCSSAYTGAVSVAMSFNTDYETPWCPLPRPNYSVESQVVTIQLNGEPREVPEGLSLGALIEWLQLPPDRVAVERNLEIVPRARWNETPIQAGDQLEVVHLVGGGFSGCLEATAGRSA